MKLLNYINGEFVPAQEGDFLNKNSPFDGKPLAEISSSTAIDVVLALQAAKNSRESWALKSFEERSAYLGKVADYLEKNRDEISFQEALHQGLSASFINEQNVAPAIHFLRDCSRSLNSHEGYKTLLNPTGIIGIVSSWCLSLRLVMERLAPALAAGNVCVVKISELSPITSKILGEALSFAEVPPGVVGILNGSSEVAKIIAGHPSIHGVCGVGRHSTMMELAQLALPKFKKLQLSSGAKNSAVLMPDFDFEGKLSDVLRPFLLGQGQLCWNISRVFVQENRADAFFDLAQAFISDLKPLLSPRGDEFWSPLISSEAFSDVRKNAHQMQEERGKLIVPLEKNESSGHYFPPTLVRDLTNCSVLQQEELHGPLLIVSAYKYIHEAPKWVNNNEYGHSAIVWGDQEKASRLAGKLDCARVGINRWSINDWSSVVGLKQSSFGNLDSFWAGSFYSSVKKLSN